MQETKETPWVGKSPGGEHSNPLQYSCLENPMDRGAWQATVHRVAKSQTGLKQPGSSSMYIHKHTVQVTCRRDYLNNLAHVEHT